MYLIIVVYLKHKKHWKPNFEKKKTKETKTTIPQNKQKIKKGVQNGKQTFP